MKELLKPLKNWRTILLLLLAMPAAFLILCEAEDTSVFIKAKVCGALLATVTYLLARYWDARGKLPELADLAKDY